MEQYQKVFQRVVFPEKNTLLWHLTEWKAKWNHQAGENQNQRLTMIKEGSPCCLEPEYSADNAR